jgi:hypothetical protein
MAAAAAVAAVSQPPVVEPEVPTVQDLEQIEGVVSSYLIRLRFFATPMRVWWGGKASRRRVDIWARIGMWSHRERESIHANGSSIL